MNSKYLFTVSFLFVVLASTLFASANTPTPTLTSVGGAVTAVQPVLVSAVADGAVNAVSVDSSRVADRVAVLKAQYLRTRITAVQAREKYTLAKQKAVRVRAEYVDTQAKWIDAKKAYVAATNSTNATEMKRAAVGKGQDFLQKQIDRMISHLELVRSKVEGMEVLEDDEKILILADLDVDIAEFEDIKARAENVTDADVLRNLSIEVKEAWIDSRKGVARAVGKMECAHEENMVEQVQKFTRTTENAIFQLEKRGIDTAEADALLNAYKNHLQLAKGELDAAKEQFAAGNTEEGRSHVQASHRYVVAAHNELKGVVREIREAIKKARQQAQ
ncbi:MAG: hypothetical protein KAJ24_04920 [Candidatus Aenigmarchaeota archaeon]|nr:hypothetical protein [Candidatus Aenigmarchaeota archaeon]